MLGLLASTSQLQGAPGCIKKGPSFLHKKVPSSIYSLFQFAISHSCSTHHSFSQLCYLVGDPVALVLVQGDVAWVPLLWARLGPWALPSTSLLSLSGQKW